MDSKKILKLFQKRAKLGKSKDGILLWFHYYTALTFLWVFWFVVNRRYKLPSGSPDEWLDFLIALAYLIIWVIATFRTVWMWRKLQKCSKKIAQIDKEIAEGLSEL